MPTNLFGYKYEKTDKGSTSRSGSSGQQAPVNSQAALNPDGTTAVDSPAVKNAVRKFIGNESEKPSGPVPMDEQRTAEFSRGESARVPAQNEIDPTDGTKELGDVKVADEGDAGTVVPEVAPEDLATQDENSPVDEEGLDRLAEDTATEGQVERDRKAAESGADTAEDDEELHKYDETIQQLLDALNNTSEFDPIRKELEAQYDAARTAQAEAYASRGLGSSGMLSAAQGQLFGQEGRDVASALKAFQEGKWQENKGLLDTLLGERRSERQYEQAKDLASTEFARELEKMGISTEYQKSLMVLNEQLAEMGMALSHEQAIEMAAIMQQYAQANMEFGTNMQIKLATLMNEFSKEGKVMDADIAKDMADHLYRLEQEGKDVDMSRMMTMARFEMALKERGMKLERDIQKELGEFAYILEQRTKYGENWMEHSDVGDYEFQVLGTMLEKYGDSMPPDMMNDLQAAWDELSGRGYGPDEDETKRAAGLAEYYSGSDTFEADLLDAGLLDNNIRQKIEHGRDGDHISVGGRTWVYDFYRGWHEDTTSKSGEGEPTE